MKIQSRENALAWEEFVEIYRPVVYGIAVSRGLQHADALDLVQTVFISVASSIGRWEKRDNQTRFRNWLLRIAKNATLNALTRRKPDEGLGGNGHSLELADIPVAEVPSEIEIDFEYKRQLYLRAAEEVRARVTSANWMAFELTAVEGVSIELVAEELGKSVGAIYAARSRIMKQLSDLVSKVEEMYE
ncbi:MAG: sigma-70 family RNA polymerase sigma factor [Planctomycetota bacterium]